MTDFRAPLPVILLAQAGDRRALDELFQGVQRPLYEYLARLIGDAHAAEDALQEVFVLVWRKLPWLRDPRLFRPWIYRIASREGFRRLRRERWWSRLLGPAAVEQAVAGSELESPCPDLLAEVAEHLPAISPASRAVLVLHYLQGLTLDEIAVSLDIPTGTVKSRLAYGLAALRKKLNG